MKEENVIIKPWNSNSFKIALVYPNHYSAMAGLTVQTLYSLWNSHERVICERFFLPDNPSPLPSGGRFKPILSLENHIPLNQFDLIAFTFSYELDYPHLLWFLENAHIPFYRNQRNITPNGTNDIDFPVIIAGGATIRSNPLPLLSFLDAVFIGEIEPINSQFITTWFEASENSDYVSFSAIKSAFLNLLAKIPGFWCPQSDSVSIRDLPGKLFISHVIAKNLDEIPHPLAQIKPILNNQQQKKGEKEGEGLSSNIAFTDALFVEIARGCPHICRFCMTGNQVKPYRFRSLENIQKIILKGSSLTNISRIALIGSSVTDHSDFKEIAEFIISHGWGLNVPSIRIDKLTPEMAHLLQKGGMKTVTIAPETGSDSLRKRLNKHLTNIEIIQGARLLRKLNITALKIYVIFGFPFEQDDDIDQLIILLNQLCELGFGKRNIRVSLNPFIPKAHTPFETAVDAYLDPQMPQLKQKIKFIKRALQKNSKIQLSFMSLYEAYLQTVLALGDERFARLIEEWYRESLKPKDWYKYCLDDSHIWRQEISSYFQEIKSLPFGERPWNCIIHHVSPKWLQKQWNKSRR
ncbi:MAG: hypothetical protein DRO88_01745 [Promethearchaeia archaeon]|nr:MAG: hypothetical protein DRO88_01745 [Candidatus Lokiarchaeia archaeon]